MSSQPYSRTTSAKRQMFHPWAVYVCSLLALSQVQSSSTGVMADPTAASRRLAQTAEPDDTAPAHSIVLGPGSQDYGRDARGQELQIESPWTGRRGGGRRKQQQQEQVGQPVGGGRKRRRQGGVMTIATLSVGHSGQKECAPGCAKNGVCNEELGRCDCPRGWTGPDCSQAPSPDGMKHTCRETHFFHYEGNCTDKGAVAEPLPFCINECNGRGTCRAGWCHCEPGYWGADCSLSMGPNGRPEVLAGRGYKPRKKKPLVYVYDLPHRLTTWRHPTYSDRPLHIHFWHRLLAAGCITTDGDQADYFYFPVSVRGPSEGLLLEAAISYVRTYWPYWDRYHGARHLVIHTGDTGRAELVYKTLTLVANTTFLSHWGLTQDYPFSGWKASHIPNRDIVLPIHMAAMGARSSGLQVSPLHPNSGADRQNVTKDTEMLFAGRICGGREEPNGTQVPNCRPISKGYSQGVRQDVHQHHWNRSGFSIATTIPNYFDKLTRTRFCLSPTGGGHGHRQILVAFSGCTPLIISDHVLQPFEPALNWSRFAVTLPQSDIPELHNILPAIPEKRYLQMQEALPCAAQHFAWSTSTGGFMHENGKYDAFETTMEILRMMIKLPGVPHDRFEAMDPEFRAFMECRSDEYYASLAPAEKAEAAMPVGADDAAHNGTNPLCSLSKWDKNQCEACLIKYKRTVPGGAICCNHVDNLAACPRLWQ